MKDPFFIIANPRSGSSLLRSLLNAHKSIQIAPECGFMLWLYPDWKNVDWHYQVKHAFALAVFESKKFHTWNITIDELESALNQNSVSSYGEAALCVYKAYALSKGFGDALLGDKNNYYIRHVSAIREIYPSAKFIHLVRDVRDVICSYQELEKKSIESVYRPKLNSDPSTIAFEWLEANNAASSAMKNSAHIRIRYEDVVLDPTNTLSKIFNLLNIEPIKKISSSIHLNTLDEPIEFLSWKERLTGPIDNLSVGRYKKELKQTSIQDVEKIAGSLLGAYGYSINTIK